MSLRTCSWLLPQKEHRYGTLGPLALLVVVTTVRSLPVLRLLRRLGGGLCDRRSFSPGPAGIVRLRDERTVLHCVDRVDDAIVPGFIGTHEVIPVRVLGHLFHRLTGVPGQDLRIDGHQM